MYTYSINKETPTRYYVSGIVDGEGLRFGNIAQGLTGNKPRFFFMKESQYCIGSTPDEAAKKFLKLIADEEQSAFCILTRIFRFRDKVAAILDGSK
jgi:hypothetical protein